MGINFVSIKCPGCGAELSIESTRRFAFCTYCGKKVLLNNDNEHIFRKIDEARIKEMEMEREIKMRELELEEAENKRKRKGTLIAYGVAMIFALAGLLVCTFDSENGAYGLLIAMEIAIFTYCKDDERKKK